MKVAMFLNFTDKPFDAYWNGRKKTFHPGKGIYMEAGIAAHHAKHLVNKILIESGHETMTSPKFPEQVPQFMELFNKAYIPQEDEEDGQTEEETRMEVLNKNRGAREAVVHGAEHMASKPSMVVTGPKGDEDDEFEDTKTS